MALLLALLLVNAAEIIDLPDPAELKALLVSSLFGTPRPEIRQIGRVKTVSGTTSIVRGGQRSPATPGTQIYQGDVAETGPDGSIGITLIDDTVLSTGPDSRLTLTEYRFDLMELRGNMLAELKTGTLAVVSGDITHNTPGAMSIKTPSSILGVRGTTFGVEIGADGLERYVILPNADGREGSGAITVRQGDAATTLDQAYAAAELRDGTTMPIGMDPTQAETLFRQALAARPVLPAHFRLNFLLDSDQMTAEAAAAYPEVVAEIKKRQIYEVELAGHTDTLADENHNKRLSRDRALAIQRALIHDGIAADTIAVVARGQSELLIPTGLGVAEPRNRRVEVIIR